MLLVLNSFDRHSFAIFNGRRCILKQLSARLDALSGPVAMVARRSVQTSASGTVPVRCGHIADAVMTATILNFSVRLAVLSV